MNPAAVMPSLTLADVVALTDRQLDVPVAAAAAGIHDAGSAAPQGERYVLLSIASTHYAVLESFVTELDRIPKITAVPRVPAWVRGVTNLRGDVLSVLDMRTFLGLDATVAHTARMLVVRLLTEDFTAGLLVDRVERIVSVPRHDITPPESALEGPLAEYVTGMCVIDERLVAVLDLDRLLRSSDIRQFEEIDEEHKDGDGAVEAL